MRRRKGEGEENIQKYRQITDLINIDEDVLQDKYGDDEKGRNEFVKELFNKLYESWNINVENIKKMISKFSFDMKKLEAINGDKIRALSIEEFLERSLPFQLRENVISGNENEVSLVKQALPIIQERIIKLSEVVPMLSFLFKKKLEFDEETKKKIKESDSQKVLKSALASIEALNDWSHTRIEEALRKPLS